MTFEFIIALGVFALISSITPGPNNLMLMASGANFGFRRTVPHLLGIAVGFQVMINLVGAGLIRLFDAFPISYVILKILSAGFLLYLAWNIARASAPITGATNTHSGKPLTFLQAAAFQWVNPKAWALSLAGVTAYSLPERPLLSLFAVGAAFIIVGVPCIIAWTFLGTQIRRLLNNNFRLRIFNYTCAILLVASLWPIVTSF